MAARTKLPSTLAVALAATLLLPGCVDLLLQDETAEPDASSSPPTTKTRDPTPVTTRPPAPLQLPQPISDAAAVWTGKYVYVFGGSLADGIQTDRIVRINLSSDSVMTLTTRLPQAREGMHAAFDGRLVYLFGGCTSCGRQSVGAFVTHHRDVLTFDTTNERLAGLDVTIPQAYVGAAVAPANGSVFFFEQRTREGPNNDSASIGRFDLATQSFFAVKSRFPGTRTNATAFQVRDDVFVVGGDNATGPTRQLVEFNPRIDQVRVRGALPASAATKGMAGFWTGNALYLVGGEGGVSTNLQRFDPSTGQTVTLENGSSPARADAQAVWTGSVAVMAGGRLAGTRERTADIWIHRPAAFEAENALPFATLTAGGTTERFVLDPAGTHDPDGQIRAYGIEWGDGSGEGGRSYQAYPINIGPRHHEYDEPGRYLVRFWVEDDRGAFADRVRWFDVASSSG